MDKRKSWNNIVILVDAVYADNVVLDLTVNFERMLNRRIPKADIARWLDCLALDAGIREGDNNIDVVFVHPSNKKEFDNFAPSSFADELNDKAFKDNLGEFNVFSFTDGEIVEGEQFFSETLKVLADAKEIKHLLVVGNTDDMVVVDDIRTTLKQVKDKDCMVFSMQPIVPGNYKQEILGYSLMSALGIRGEEFGK